MKFDKYWKPYRCYMFFNLSKCGIDMGSVFIEIYFFKKSPTNVESRIAKTVVVGGISNNQSHHAASPHESYSAYVCIAHRI